MIVLKADSELKMTFERLIKTMHANVNWTGLFVALDNYLILQGEVRSLFFHFDSRKVAENIVDLPIKEDEIKDTDEAKSTGCDQYDPVCIWKMGNDPGTSCGKKYGGD